MERFIFTASFYDEMEEKEITEDGFVASNTFAGAMKYIEDYYGNNNLNAVKIDTLESLNSGLLIFKNEDEAKRQLSEL